MSLHIKPDSSGLATAHEARRRPADGMESLMAPPSFDRLHRRRREQQRDQLLPFGRGPAMGGANGLGTKVGEAVRLIAEDVEASVEPDCGHFMTEEAPAAVIRQILKMVAKTNPTVRDPGD